jgi:hypothetical protein
MPGRPSSAPPASPLLARRAPSCSPSRLSLPESYTNVSAEEEVELLSPAPVWPALAEEGCKPLHRALSGLACHEVWEEEELEASGSRAKRLRSPTSLGSQAWAAMELEGTASDGAASDATFEASPDAGLPPVEAKCLAGAKLSGALGAAVVPLREAFTAGWYRWYTPGSQPV